MQSRPCANTSSSQSWIIGVFFGSGKIRPAEGLTTMADRIHVPPGQRLVFRPWRTCPTTGQRLYAKMYGFRAWPILIPE